VISVHELGATVRLEEGRLAAVPADDVAAHRPIYLQALASKAPLTFETVGVPRGRHLCLQLARPPAALAGELKAGPVSAQPATDAAAQAVQMDDSDAVEPLGPPVRLRDEAFEEQIARYLKSTEEWAPPDALAPAERHFLRKKRRAAYFEARTKGT
jgi:hypothetical protein